MSVLNLFSIDEGEIESKGERDRETERQREEERRGVTGKERIYRIKSNKNRERCDGRRESGETEGLKEMKG